MSKTVLQCPHAKKCGGCQLQNMTYERQLSFKQVKVIKLLGKYRHVDEIIGMDCPYHYRNKVQAAFGEKNGEIISGIYQSSTHKIVPVDKCLIEDEKADEIIVTIRKLAKSFKLRAFNDVAMKGFLRHVLIKRGFSSGEIMVVLVTGAMDFPKEESFVNALLSRHPEITTIVQNVNNKRTSLLLGEESRVLFGSGYIEEDLCGFRFRISPRAFYQVNPTQTAVLYGKALEFAELSGKERVLDAYCGTGTIGIIASPLAKRVVGVELNADAVGDAKVNAELNGVKNISFFEDDAGRFMVKEAQKGAKYDVVIMDPPRAGASQDFLKCLVALSPKKVVYISCNPETQARDVAFLVKNGYRVKKIQPVDMFPHTEHVECVVSLSREKADDYRKESKMISDERSRYKSWSNLKKHMNDLLCDSLKDKISYFYTSYHEVHNAYGRATINYCKKEMVAFSWVEMYKQEQEVSQLYQEGKKVSYGELEKEKWMPECKLCDADFINSMTIYLKTDIVTSLNSDNYLLRVFAYMDRRVGKRTLIKIKDDVEKLPDWVKQFYRIRCEADGIIFPPKRITDETVVLLSREKADDYIRISVHTKDLQTNAN